MDVSQAAPQNSPIALIAPPPAVDVRQRWGVPRCGYFANAIMLWISLRFLWLAYAIVWFAALYFFLFVRKARRGSMAYLDRLRPGRSLFRRAWESYRHLAEFGFLLIDRALMLATPHHGFAISCDGIENLHKAASLNNGLLMLTAHFGNAEIGAPYMHETGFTKPFHIVMYMDAADGTEKFHAAHRCLMDKMNIISTTDPLSAGVKIINALRAGDTVAMRADRTMSGKTISATLLNGRIELPLGPFLSAALTGSPLVQVYTCRLGYRRYLCVIRPIRGCDKNMPGTREERLAAAAQDYADGLEDILRKYPYQWSNFYDYWQVQGTPAAT